MAKSKRNSKIENKGQLRPVGEIKIVDPRGYAYLPKILRKEVNATGKTSISFFISANCVLLIRKGADLQRIIEGLEILKKDLILRIEK
jgi:hypothetical protein